MSMRKKLWFALFFVIFSLPFDGDAGREMSSLPPIVEQIVGGNAVAVTLEGWYFTEDGWEGKTKEKFVLRIKEVKITYPKVSISGQVFDKRNRNLVGSFGATLTIISSHFFQFSATMDKLDGARFAYEGDLFLIGEKLKGTFISEMQEQANNGCPAEIGGGKTELALL